MKKNGIKEAWNNGQTIINGWSSIANTFNAEIMAASGFDSITIDMQHGLVGYQKVVEMLQAISGYNITPMVRVPWNDPSMVMRCLDAGAYGIICPMVNTKEECEKFVTSCRYPPKGNRSFGPIRARMYGGDDYFHHANETLLNFAMIETSEAVDNLDKILSVDELDAVYIGPSDLAVTMGYTPGAYQKEVEDCLIYIVETCKSKNIKTGIHCPDGKTVKERFDMGYHLGTISADAALLTQASKREIADAK
jgi:4-hydroxy-2-oxoheptanedioate aldolase